MNPLVLIIEDNEKNLKLVRDILQFKGFRTLEASCALDGLSLAGQHSPDVILMDVQLPDLDGVTALGRLRTEPATAMIPVVAVTAFAMPSDAERFMRAGFEGYLTKPLDIKTFPDQVREFCVRGRASGEA